jgi:hypothetical protein
MRMKRIPSWIVAAIMALLLVKLIFCNFFIYNKQIQKFGPGTASTRNVVMEGFE